MAYIANRPVRFDHNYKVGEVIPPEVIEPKMVRKLIDMGRILCVDILNEDTNTKEPTTSERDVDNGNPIELEPVSEGQLDAPNSDIIQMPDNNSPEPAAEVPNSNSSESAEVFTCKVCGKAFKSQNALSAHSRSHKD